jgi:phosphoribosylamine--glycine ligase
MNLDQKINILVIGSGGREHALCWKLAQSPWLDRLYVAPGNDGMAHMATLVSLAILDAGQVIEFCLKQNIKLVVIGPEAPLVAGLVDQLQLAGIAAFGPTKAAAILESSKAFTKQLCDEYGIPTAAFGVFTEKKEAETFILKQSLPVVVKADGLAAGKGVIIAETYQEALDAVDMILSGKFGIQAGQSVVIEEFLEGEEVSYFALCDHEDVLGFTSAQDHKRVGDGDTGPNTGGMGTYSPAPCLTAKWEEDVLKSIIKPTLKAMVARGTPFQGVLFAGLILTKKGPYLLEYNVRFGDPETQSMMRRLASDLVPALWAVATGRLGSSILSQWQWHPGSAMCVVMAACGYPGEIMTPSSVIRGIEKADQLSDVVVFHAATSRLDEHSWQACGGRVLGVSALAEDIIGAYKKAYQGVELIDWPDGFYRTDIGWRALPCDKSMSLKIKV